MEGALTSSTGEGDDDVANYSSSLLTTSGSHCHAHASPRTQRHPVGHSHGGSPTQMHPFRESTVDDNGLPVQPNAQICPVDNGITGSPTHNHLLRKSPTNHQNGTVYTNNHLTNDSMESSHSKSHPTKSSSEFQKSERRMPANLPVSRNSSSSKKSHKKKSRNSSTHQISARLNEDFKGTPMSQVPSNANRAGIPNRAPIRNRSPSRKDSVKYKEVATCTATPISTASPICKDSPVHRPAPDAQPPIEMPKVSPTHKASPTHRAGSKCATPTKERHTRRTINANGIKMVATEMEEAGTEQRNERIVGSRARIQAMMEQEIQRLSLQKREVVMKDRVVEPESWKRDVQKQMEEELEQRVRDALETPPLERMRRNRQKAKLQCIKKQQTSISLEECDNYAHSLPNLRTTLHHLWDLSETPYSLTDTQQNRRNRLSHLTGNPQPGSQRRDNSDTEEDGSGDSTTAANRNQNSCSWRLQPLHHHNNRLSENSALAVQDNDSYSDQDSDSEQARTVAEMRRKIFRQYTAEGFKSALRKGKSHLKNLGNGKYEDKHGVVLTTDGPFWPPECGPLYPKPEHQNFIPLDKELLANAVPDNGRTVHNQRTKWFRPFEATSVNVFDSERTSKGTVPPNVPEGCPPSLVFESRFESGNLRQARRVGQFEYNLILKTDLYTPRHTQWFYFRVQRMVPGVTYKFNIVNLLKKDSLYNHGMRPLKYSEREAAKSTLGWHRTGHHINYTRSCGFHRNPLLHVDVAYYTLSWQLEFTYENDTCYFAHCYPYTFTDLRQHIDDLLADPERRRCTKREVMCESRAGNSCFLLTVTNFNEKQRSNKRGIVVTARVHPGETNASWMMKGLLDYITGSDPIAKDLRKAFVFKIIPMLNPDGVIVGNYRCSLTGRDLNRNFRHPKKESFPTVWHAKEMLEDFSKETEVLVYCDLHGHSRRHNVFIYGCDKNGKEIDAASFLYQRLFPFLMSREAPDKFSFRGCKFHVKRCKEATGRVVMHRELGISNSFTMEATFCGSKDIRREDTPRHFNLLDFEDLGRHFCEALMVYHNAQENKSLHSELMLELTREITHQVLTSRGLLPQQLLPPYGNGTETYDRDGTTTSEAQRTSETTGNANQPSHAVESSRAPSSGPDKAGQLVRRLEGRLETMRMIDTLSSETIQGCIGILHDLHAMKDFAESDSSDSDSASESEAPVVPTEDKLEEKKKKKKKGKNRSKSIPASRAPSLADHGTLYITRGDGKLHLTLALKSQANQGLPSISSADPAASSQSYPLLSRDLGVGSLGPDVRPFRTACRGKTPVSSYNERSCQLYPRDRHQTDPTLYRIVEPMTLKMPLEAQQRIGNQEVPGTSQWFLPSISAALYYDEDLNPGECGQTSQMIKKYPPFVNRYIGRSNSGIPMFAQERLLERASKRMEAMRRLEQERPERKPAAFQLSDDGGDYAHLLTLHGHLPQEDQEECQLKLGPPTLTAHSNIPATPGYPLQVNMKHGYTHRNPAMIRGHPLGREPTGDGLQEIDERQDNAHITVSRQCPRKLEPMSDARTLLATATRTNPDSQRIGQVQGAFVDQITSDLRNGALDTNDPSDHTTRPELTYHHGDPSLTSGRLTNGEARKPRSADESLGLDGGRTLTEMDLRPSKGEMEEKHLNPGMLPSFRTPSGRGDQNRMQSARTHGVSNPWFGARNLQTVGRTTMADDGGRGQAPPPLRSPRGHQPSAVKKNHVDLIEQQYGRFLSGVGPKRAPSTTARYLQSLARSMKGSEGPANQLKTGTKQGDKK